MPHAGAVKVGSGRLAAQSRVFCLSPAFLLSHCSVPSSPVAFPVGMATRLLSQLCVRTARPLVAASSRRVTLSARFASNAAGADAVNHTPAPIVEGIPNSNADSPLMGLTGGAPEEFVTRTCRIYRPGRSCTQQGPEFRWSDHTEQMQRNKPIANVQPDRAKCCMQRQSASVAYDGAWQRRRVGCIEMPSGCVAPIPFGRLSSSTLPFLDRTAPWTVGGHASDTDHASRACRRTTPLARRLH